MVTTHRDRCSNWTCTSTRWPLGFFSTSFTGCVRSKNSKRSTSKIRFDALVFSRSTLDRLILQITHLLHCWHQIFLLSLCEYKFEVPWMNLIHCGTGCSHEETRHVCFILGLFSSRSIEWHRHEAFARHAGHLQSHSTAEHELRGIFPSEDPAALPIE